MESNVQYMVQFITEEGDVVTLVSDTPWPRFEGRFISADIEKNTEPNARTFRGVYGVMGYAEVEVGHDYPKLRYKTIYVDCDSSSTESITLQDVPPEQ